MTACHTPLARSETVAGWDPWRALRNRKHIRLTYRQMHPSRGKIVDHANGMRTITLDPRLNQIDRRCVLSHELVHDDLDLLWTPNAPQAIVQKGERLVELVSDELLLPPVDLRAWLERRPEDDQVTAWHVAGEFEVSIDVASRSLDRLVAGF